MDAGKDNLTNRARFTAGRIKDFKLPEGSVQAFYWDTLVPGLGLRVTKSARAYIFQSRIHGRSFRVKIGPEHSWGVEEARAEARRLRVMTDSGQDPRSEKQGQADAANAERLELKRRSVTLADAWKEYEKARKPDWSQSHIRDHEHVMQAPGQQRARSNKLTVSGPLWELRELPLTELSAEGMLQWIAANRHRPASAARAFRLLRTFLNWCAEQEDYAGLAPTEHVLTKSVRRAVPKPKAKDDVLQREQLVLWFASVRALPDSAISACLQTLLLTGARTGEVIRLRWEDVDFRWRVLRLGDKVEDKRDIPLTPYVGAMMHALPRRNAFVFASSDPKTPDTAISWPHHAHERALKAAGLPHLSLHGLRRSFGTLSEWVETPVGVAAQIQGHKPSAIAEKHYRRRPLDLLRQWHDKIEAWILDQADIKQPSPGNAAGILRLATDRGES